MEMQGVSIPIEKKKKAAVVPLFNGAMDLAFDLVQKIRKYEVSSEMVISEKKLGNLLASLEAAGVDNALLIGDNELESSQVAIRNLVSREQVTLSLNDIDSIVSLIR